MFGGKAIGITYNPASQIILKEENIESSAKTKEREVDQKKKGLKI